MSKRITFKKRLQDIIIHDYDSKIATIYRLIQKELSKQNIALITKYDQHMLQLSLSKATRLKHLQMILSLSIILKKDWTKVLKDDIDNLVFKIVQTYGDSSDKGINTSYDHKKILKIFFRWIKLGSRDFKEVGTT